MENEEGKIAKAYAIIAIYTIVLLIVGVSLGFAVGRKSVLSEREQICITNPDTLQVERVVPFP